MGGMSGAETGGMNGLGGIGRFGGLVVSNILLNRPMQLLSVIQIIGCMIFVHFLLSRNPRIVAWQHFRVHLLPHDRLALRSPHKRR